MIQKFRMLSFVHVTEDLTSYEPYMDTSLLDQGYDAIIEGTYSQIHGGGGHSLTQYAVYKIRDGVVVDRRAWIDEEDIELLEGQDTLKAEEMMEVYNIK